VRFRERQEKRRVRPKLIQLGLANERPAGVNDIAHHGAPEIDDAIAGGDFEIGQHLRSPQGRREIVRLESHRVARQPREPGVPFRAIRRLEGDLAFHGGLK
jgi:hypothetical protein